MDRANGAQTLMVPRWSSPIVVWQPIWKPRHTKTRARHLKWKSGRLGLSAVADLRSVGNHVTCESNLSNLELNKLQKNDITLVFLTFRSKLPSHVVVRPRMWIPITNSWLCCELRMSVVTAADLVKRWTGCCFRPVGLVPGFVGSVPR